jgi:hypothetical protein
VSAISKEKKAPTFPFTKKYDCFILSFSRENSSNGMKILPKHASYNAAFHKLKMIFFQKNILLLLLFIKPKPTGPPPPPTSRQGLHKNFMDFFNITLSPARII